MSEFPTREDIDAALGDIRSTGCCWDYEHPERAYPLVEGWLGVQMGSIARLAAYRLRGLVPPMGYYDEVIDWLYWAAETIARERSKHHGDAQSCLYPGTERSKHMRASRENAQDPSA